MTEIVVIFLKQVTFISEFLLKNSNATENYSVITNRNGLFTCLPQEQLTLILHNSYCIALLHF